MEHGITADEEDEQKSESIDRGLQRLDRLALRTEVEDDGSGTHYIDDDKQDDEGTQGILEIESSEEVMHGKRGFCKVAQKYCKKCISAKKYRIISS